MLRWKWMGPGGSIGGRLPAVASLAALGWVAVTACTVTADHPPDAPDCSGLEGGCPVTPVSGGGGGSNEGGTVAGGCVVSTLDSQCIQCANLDCCSSYAACSVDVDCSNLSSCEDNCGGQSTCITDCQRQSPNGVGLLGILTDCLEAKCVVCSESGVGDPCVPVANTCNPGLSCGGLWCTKPCVRSTDCTGLGAAGGNALNLPNACVLNGAAEICTPGCEVDEDCASFPGTFCFGTTSVDGLAVHVCSPVLDAGAAD